MRAIGHTGEEEVAIRIDGSIVDTYRLPRASGSFWGTPDRWHRHSYRHDGPLAPGQVRIEFTNNGRSAGGGDRNMRVDRIEIDGTRFETEAPEVVSQGSWGNGSRCNTGAFGLDNLACTGWIQYAGGEPIEPPAPVDPRDDPPTPSPSGPISVASLGDSNTSSGYWRRPFQDAVACEVDMIGATATHWHTIDFTGYDKDTDGVGGATIATFRNPGNAIFEHGRSTLADDPDAVVVLGGTNDMRFLDLANVHHRQVLDDTMLAIRQQLTEAAATAPDARFHVVAIPPIRGREANSVTYNGQLAALVADLASDLPVTWVDPGATDADLAADGVHLTFVGGVRYGNAIAASVSAADCG